MPIYEYQAISTESCPFCCSVFEIRQSIHDKCLTVCPECGNPVKRLLSRSFVSVTDSLTMEQRLETHTEEEADRLGLNGGFATDQIWE